ncbi:MAG TPA: transglycosylase family protein [Solirubrobacterales bacterium]|nr:transglycosylase family protein [Solirubrobacterales bacterium]
MLTERKHIALLGIVVALAAPAVASAAQDGKAVPRERLRAFQGEPVVAIGEAQLVSGSLLRPVDRDSLLIAVTTKRTEHRRKVEARKREERERFSHLPGGVTMAMLESIAACESGGNPEAVSPDGTYRGKYQFDQGTWESVGGHGDPAKAPEAEQDYRAALLYAESGSSPWPVCG